MKRLIFLIPIAVVLLVSLTTANAQRINDPSSPQSGYDLSWYTIDSGGATLIIGGSYSLGGTIGQPAAEVLSGGSYSLGDGFWDGTAVSYNIYLPLTLKNF